MSPARRRALLTGLLLLSLIAAAGWSVSWMRAQAAQARRAEQNLLECRELARAIEGLRERPQLASAGGLGAKQWGRRIEEARAAAGLHAEALEGVFPKPPRRVGHTPYRRKPMTVSLQGAALPELTVFLHHLTEAPGVRLRALRLRTPRGAEPGPPETWDAEARLADLVYDPGHS